MTATLEHINTTSNKHRPKVLMVDDRPENLIALERVLRDMNLDLYKAENGNDALALTLHHDFALALLDIQMPEMDGYELAEILRQEEKTADLPFIFLSAIHTDQINIFKGYEKGAFSYITKPFEPEQLLIKVKFFIEKYNQAIALREYANELEELNKELESFSYSVSHDLRAPLRAITGFSEILIKKNAEQLDESGKKYLQNISNSAQKMAELIDAILAFSRLGRQAISSSEFSLSSLFDEVYKDLTVHDTPTGLSFDLEQDLPMVKADYNLMRQVAQNLLANAIKYSSKSEQPEIKVGQDIINNRLVYFVQDNGAGFDMKYYDKLFGVFQRLHRDSEFEGNGVGLALTKRIIERHEGNIWAEGELGKGATFYFTLNQKHN